MVCGLIAIKEDLTLKVRKMKATETRMNLDEEKGKLKQKFASLINDDQLFEEGRQEVLSGKRKARIEQTKKELDKLLSAMEELDKLWSSL